MSFKNLFSLRNRILLGELVRTDFKLRYQGSVLGYLWTLLRPLMLFAVLYIVFGYVLKQGSSIEHYPVYLLLGVILWSFFTEATNNGLSSIVGRGDLIRKINFPKYIIVISGTVSALINLFFNLVVVIIFMIFAGVEVTPTMLLFPLLVAELYVFSLAVAFFLSSTYVKFRDIAPLWEVIMQAAFYATPVLYPLSLVLDRSHLVAEILLMNPVAQVIQDSRYAVVTHESGTLYQLTNHIWLYAIPFILIAISIISAAWYFRKQSRYFAENV